MYKRFREKFPLFEVLYSLLYIFSFSHGRRNVYAIIFQLKLLVATRGVSKNTNTKRLFKEPNNFNKGMSKPLQESLS